MSTHSTSPPAELHDMSRQELTARIAWARSASPAQIVERQKRERRQHAERLAARFVSVF